MLGCSNSRSCGPVTTNWDGKGAVRLRLILVVRELGLNLSHPFLLQGDLEPGRSCQIVASYSIHSNEDVTILGSNRCESHHGG